MLIKLFFNNLLDEKYCNRKFFYLFIYNFHKFYERNLIGVGSMKNIRKLIVILMIIKKKK